jgi:glutathione peroxidase
MIHFNILIQSLLAAVISFYSLSVKNSSGSTVSFANYTGKKILIVNTCIQCADTAQYAKLEQFYQKYKDSVIVIVVPSNSFGNTPMANPAIQNFLQQRYNYHFILTEKMDVKGANIAPLFSWLADEKKNGLARTNVKTNFTKYLIDKDGFIMGNFNKNEDIMGAKIKALIESSN